LPTKNYESNSRFQKRTENQFKSFC
jgi:hypothetical protein